MQILKYFIFILIILSGLFFLLGPVLLSFVSQNLGGPEVIPDNFQPQEISGIAKNSDIIIIFNSGGWGNTPLEKADDFNLIIKGIQETLNNWGYRSIVVPYQRTKNSFWGKVSAAREMFLSFQGQSAILSEDINQFLKENPGKKIVITGLSSGAAFAEETMEKISDSVRDRIFAIEAGVPFWKKSLGAENILRLDNKGRDYLAKGEIGSLFFSLFQAPLNWIQAKLAGENISLARAFQASGHLYFWPGVQPEVTSFLGEKLK